VAIGDANVNEFLLSRNIGEAQLDEAMSIQTISLLIVRERLLQRGASNTSRPNVSDDAQAVARHRRVDGR
jgi:hypothetical protein